MRILALDAATEACSAALYEDGDVRERFEIAPREHASLLLPMAHGLLAEAGWKLHDLDALALGRGPGAFTGLRIAAGVAQGLALGADLPVVPVSDLAALAVGAARTCGAERVLAVADARMREVYWCAFEAAGSAGGPRPVAMERVSAPADIPATGYGSDWVPAGNGWSAYASELAPLGAGLAGPVRFLYPRAGDIARLGAVGAERGDGLPAEQGLPSYVRDDVARKPG